MNEPIQITLGVADEVNHMPMGFWLYDDGVQFDGEMTKKDIDVALAVLLDLADALRVKLNAMTN